jgi:hypothetical protein
MSAICSNSEKLVPNTHKQHLLSASMAKQGCTIRDFGTRKAKAKIRADEFRTVRH